MISILRRLLILTIGLYLLAAPSTHAESIRTAFTYQWQLKKADLSLTGQLTLEFQLWTAETVGSLVGADGPVTLSLDNGIFTTKIDFDDNIFLGNIFWFEVHVKEPKEIWEIFSPRRPITAVLYSLTSIQAERGRRRFPRNGRRRADCATGRFRRPRRGARRARQRRD